MKLVIKLFCIVFLLASGCQDGYIDELTRTDPGPDEAAPEVTINYPQEGAQLQVNEAVTSINIKFEVSDDIEIEAISLAIDGTEIASFSEFKDFRRYVGEYLYDNVTNGVHELTITATDVDGKSSSKTVSFEKLPPYTPRYDGEIFYMPFNGDYMELVSITNATEVGSPGFAGEGVQGENAYAGASGAYLTFPAAELTHEEFSAVFWFKVNATPNRAGILVIGPPDEANPDAMNNRTSGFRFFREEAAGKQRFKLNVGTGEGEAWFDGGEAADVDPAADQWVHFAFTISGSEAAVYIDGQPVSQGTFDGIDWSGCDLLSIMSGAPRFTGWDHLSDESFMDELRLFEKALSQEEIQSIMETESGGSSGYEPEYDGETFYMAFDGDLIEKISETEATPVGTPGFAGESIEGSDAYAGAADSYLTFPTGGLLGEEFSASFWMKINAEPDRAGILVVGPPDEANPDAMNNRTKGFRFFREAVGEAQRFKLNVGTGEADVWFDGAEAADVDPSTGEWVHFAFTISGEGAAIFINGEEVSSGALDGVDWTGCDMISIMSGAPRFTEWGHFSDESFLDELRLFNKALSQEEIQTIMNDE